MKDLGLRNPRLYGLQHLRCSMLLLGRVVVYVFEGCANCILADVPFLEIASGMPLNPHYQKLSIDMGLGFLH